MKNTLLTLVLFLLVAGLSFAQAPESLNYQGVARDINNNALTNQSIGLQISIRSGSATNPAIYTETHTVTTSALGLFTIAIGSGTSTLGTFSSIDWGNDQHFMEIEMDAAGGTNYLSMGTSELLSVPYALHAKTAGNVFSGDYTDLSNAPTNVSSFSNDAGYITSPNDADADPANELQSLSISGSNLAISSGNSVTLPAEVDGSVTNELQILSTNGDTLFISSGNFVLLPNSADPSPTNEIQTISQSGDTVSLSLGGGMIVIDGDTLNEIQNLSQVLAQGNNAGDQNIQNVDSLAIGTNTPLADLHVQGGTVLFRGDNNGSTPVSGAGTRFMWIPTKHSIRAGEVFGTQWDDANIGTHSVGMGWNALASAPYAVSIGRNNSATENHAVALGDGTIASGSKSMSTGFSTRALSFAEFVVGIYNETYTPNSVGAFNANDRLFVIGNGNSGNSRSNAMTVLKSGNVGIGTTAPTQKLDVDGRTRTNSLQVNNNPVTGYVLTSDATGVATWQAPAASVPTADNGLSISGSDVVLGGSLSGTTNIDLGSNNMQFNMNGSGDFVVQKDGVDHLKINNGGNGIFGGDMTFRKDSATGADLIKMTQTAGNGQIQVYNGAAVQHKINADGNTTFNNQGLDADFIVEGENDANAFYVDASTDNVGIGTSAPTNKLTVAGKTKTDELRVVTGATSGYVLTSDANGNATWQAAATSTPSADNGLSISGSDVVLGGTLNTNTTITQGGRDFIFDLNGNGDLYRNDGPISRYKANNNGNIVSGADFTWRNDSVTGTNAAAITQTGGNGNLLIYNNGSIQHDLAGDGTVVFNENGLDKNFRVESDNETQALFVKGSNDRVGIGTNNPLGPLHVDHDVELSSSSYMGTLIVGESGGRLMSFDNNEIQVFDTGGPKELFLQSRGGNMELGSSGSKVTVPGWLNVNFGGVPSYPVHVKGPQNTWQFALHNSTTNGKWEMGLSDLDDLLLGLNGTIMGAFSWTNGAYINVSDSTMKKNITDIPSVLKDINQLRPVNYNFKHDTANIQKEVGFLAQEVELIFPEAVHMLPTGKYSLNYTVFGPLAIKAIQELDAKVVALETEKAQKDATIDELKAQLDLLSSRIESIEVKVEMRAGN